MCGAVYGHQTCHPSPQKSSNPHILSLSPPISLDPNGLVNTGLHHEQNEYEHVRIGMGPGIQRKKRRMHYGLGPQLLLPQFKTCWVAIR